MSQSVTERWWKEATIYQIYPRSFNDSTGDGVGDIPGIVERLDHLDRLGVDGVWLCPVYRSPQVDNGYDVADYRAIHDEYGTMRDFERLLDALHDRGMRLVMDLVVNHTSDEHEWFRRSRRGDDGYRDWYHWREGRGPNGERPPNNWESFFGGPAWEYDEAVGEWYLHLFHRRQPDLNWRTPAVRAAIRDVMEFWLEKGVDGFRFDVVNMLSKREGYPDGEPNPVQVGSEHFVNGPRIHEYVSEMYDRVLSRYDAVTVGEMAAVTPEEASRYLLPDGDGLSMVFTFDHLRTDWGDGRWDVADWDVAAFTDGIERWQTELDGTEWYALCLGNHDEPRVVSRFGDERYRRESATLFATLLFTLRGTPFVYQGDEVGMTNYPFTADEVRDVEAEQFVDRAGGDGELDGDALATLRGRSRDNARTPMQWSDDEHAGFTTGEPWMPVNRNADRVNVADAVDDSTSVLNYYRTLAARRKEEPVLVYGEFERLPTDAERTFAYVRWPAGPADDEVPVLVALNLSSARRTFDVPPAVGDPRELVVGNYESPAPPGATLDLRPWEAVVYRLA